jgi:glycine/D-amino acid oxidase-like deaminating enzyme
MEEEVIIFGAGIFGVTTAVEFKNRAYDDVL